MAKLQNIKGQVIKTSQLRARVTTFWFMYFFKTSFTFYLLTHVINIFWLSS